MPSTRQTSSSSSSSRPSRTSRNSRDSRDPRASRDARGSQSSRSSRSSSNQNEYRYNTKANRKSYVLPDPRPSKADPEHRQTRKQKEEECGGFDWGGVLGLALTGAAAAFSIDQALKQHDERKANERSGGKADGHGRSSGKAGGKR